MKKKLIKLSITTIVWSLIYWGTTTTTGYDSWLSIAVLGAFVSSMFVVAIED